MTGNGHFSRDYDLKSQIRRAAISVMNNIAEGFGRYSKREFARFLEVSTTSALEVKSIMYIALDLRYCEAELVASIQQKAEEVKALNLALIRHLNSKPSDLK